jgi:hypothetical protein
MSDVKIGFSCNGKKGGIPTVSLTLGISMNNGDFKL